MDNSKTQTKSSFFRMAILLAFVAATAFFCLAQQPLTPTLVDKVRNEGAAAAAFNSLFFQGSVTPRSGWSLSLSYGNSEPEFVLKGIVGNGTEIVVPMSDAELITYLGTSGQYLKFSITRYAISSEELLKRKPNYTQFREYLKTTEILIPALDKKGSGLFWMGKASEYNEVERLGKVDQMATNKAIRITLPITKTWWAIPSIANDPLCPIKGLRPLGDSRGIQ